MGSSSSKIEKNKEFLSNYENENELLISMNIHSIVYKNKTINNNRILFVEMFFEDEDNLDKYVNKIKEYSNINHPNILKLKNIEKYVEFNLCKNKYFTNLYLEHHNLNLEIEIENRSKMKEIKNKYFKEDEIWYLIGTIIHTLNFLKKNKIFHKDIQPRNILITNNGEIKILLSSIYFGFYNGYKKMLEDRDYYTCISPIQIKGLKDELKKINHDKEKSEVFSIGITILSTICLTNFNAFYDYDLFEINFEKIKKKLKKLKMLSYSDELIELIEFMLRIREDERYTYGNLIHYINPHFEPDSSLYTSKFINKNK